MPHDSISLVIPATYADLGLLEDMVSSVFMHIDNLEEPIVQAYNVLLAIHEICANIVGHAYAGRNDGKIAMTFRIFEQPRRLTIELADSGCHFNPGTVPLPDLNEGQEGGYGLFLARNLLDQVTYEPWDGGNTWRLLKYL